MGYAEPPEVSEGELDRLNPDLSEKDRTTRVEAAIALRVAGADYSEIAEVLQYVDVAHARQAVERGLAATLTDEDVTAMRTIANRRLDRLLRAVMPKVVGEENKADEVLAGARTALAIVDRSIRLNGLDAPAKVAVYSPTDSEIATFIATHSQRMVAGLPEELDIVDADIVSDEDAAAS